MTRHQLSRLSHRARHLTPSMTLGIHAHVKDMMARGVEVLNLSVGEPDFETPSRIRHAAVRALDHGWTKYTSTVGVLELRQAIAGYLRRHSHVRYTPEQIAVSNGAKHTLYNVWQTLLDRGDEVIMMRPYWNTFPEQVRLAGGKPVIVSTDEAYMLDVPAIRRAITRKTKAILLNTPNNPTGAVYSKASLAAITRLAKKHHLWIIADEIYSDIVYHSKHVSVAGLSRDAYRRTLTVGGVSKSYAMTGWRIGFVAGAADVVAAIGRLQGHMTSNPSTVSQAAAIVAFRSCDKDVKRMVAAFRKRRAVLLSELAGTPRVRVAYPHGAFYLMVDIRNIEKNSLTFAKRLLAKEHVAVIPGIAFGLDGAVRISYAQPEATLREAARRIKRFITGYQPKKQ